MGLSSNSCSEPKKRLEKAAPMNSIQHLFGTFYQILQGQLFPRLEEELGDMSAHHRQLVRALALLEMDGFVAVRRGRGRPAHDRAKIARAFLAKAVFNISNTRALLDRLTHDTVTRRLCGWEQAAQLPLTKLNKKSVRSPRLPEVCLQTAPVCPELHLQRFRALNRIFSLLPTSIRL
jgi:hypothetical protein